MPDLPDSKSLYEEYKNGATEEELAEKYNTTRSTVHGRIYRYKQKLDEINFDTEEEELSENGDEQIKAEYKGNFGWVGVKGKSIRTLKGLLDASETDLGIWEVSRHIINKWDVTNKYGQTFQNWQVKAWLARRKPIDIFPDINPVEIPLSALKTPLRANKNRYGNKDAIERVMVVSDPHFGFNKDPITQKLIPYHNESVLQIALEIFTDNDFDYIIWGGDILDCNEWSGHFIKRPEFRQTTQPALNQASKWIASFIAEKPEIKHIVLKGNHDDRIENYIISNLDEIYNLTPGDSESAEPLMSISNLLGLKRMGVDYRDSYSIGNTKFIHGDIARKGGGATARAHLENNISNIVFAHVHRREIATETKVGYGDERIEVFAMCPGCTCYTDGRVPGSDYDDNWQNGIGVLEFLNNECISHQIIKINKDKAVYNGKLYSLD